MPASKSRAAKPAAKKPVAPAKAPPEERKKAAPPRRPAEAEEEEPEAAPTAEAREPLTRVALIRARHEFMKREIDQIREDLEAESDD